jgi:hypothetical protein
MKKTTTAVPKILNCFSAEQRTQIHRLMRAGKFSSEDETIAALAAAALYVLGLDPLAGDELCRLTKVISGSNSDA